MPLFQRPSVEGLVASGGKKADATTGWSDLDLASIIGGADVGVDVSYYWGLIRLALATNIDA